MKMVHRTYSKMMQLEQDLDDKRQQRIMAETPEEAAELEDEFSKLEAVHAA